MFMFDSSPAHFLLLLPDCQISIETKYCTE